MRKEQREQLFLSIRGNRIGKFCAVESHNGSQYVDLSEIEPSIGSTETLFMQTQPACKRNTHWFSMMTLTIVLFFTGNSHEQIKDFLSVDERRIF